MTINYIGAFFLIVIGLAIIVLKSNLIKIVIGMGILDSGINLLLISIGYSCKCHYFKHYIHIE